MLSAVLRSEVAVKVSISIMSAFVEMRKFLVDNNVIFSRLDRVELNQLDTRNRLDAVDKKFKQVFNYIAENKEVNQSVFFDGQIYDAFSLISKIVKYSEHELEMELVKDIRNFAPIGVATYQIRNSLPENMINLLSDPDGIIERLKVLDHNK